MRHQRLGTFTLLCFYIAACGGPQTGVAPTDSAATTSSESRSTSATSDWPSELPRITDPINVDHWAETPCKVLSDMQLEKFSIESEPEAGKSDPGPTCDWGDIFEDKITVGANFGTKQHSTIPGLYKYNEMGFYSYFDPVVIEDYPAVIYTESDERDAGGCAIAIGLREKHTYAMTIRLGDDHPDYGDPCSVLKDVAEMAVTTMTEGGS